MIIALDTDLLTIESPNDEEEIDAERFGSCNSYLFLYSRSSVSYGYSAGTSCPY
jgi:hypothetical protein